MNLKQKLIITSTTVLASIGIVGTGVHYINEDHTEYAKIASNNPKKEFNNIVKNETPAIVIFFSHDCKDCLSVQSIVTKTVEKYEKTSDFKILAIDKLDTGKDFMIENGVTETPTFQVRQGNKVYYQYSGTDKNKIKTILSGINPDTKEPFTIK
mgnify:CR=1 FL=1